VFKVVYFPVTVAMRRIFDDIPVECPDGCGAEVLRGNLADHARSCQSAAERRLVSTFVNLHVEAHGAASIFTSGELPPMPEEDHADGDYLQSESELVHGIQWQLLVVFGKIRDMGGRDAVSIGLVSNIHETEHRRSKVRFTFRLYNVDPTRDWKAKTHSIYGGQDDDTPDGHVRGQMLPMKYTDLENVHNGWLHRVGGVYVIKASCEFAAARPREMVADIL
jgi:hypothetical protein